MVVVVVEDKVRKVRCQAAFVVSPREGLEEEAMRRVRIITFPRTGTAVSISNSG